ncbi:Rieske (2Fe-2S) protein [Paenibacillus filicis]|uniref:Rieske (2Fe-2S) protein n=1 Tax=Paenibacillus gyeongsangnamensis TaxID=3388067 RepID=A0ABT4Q4B3_9BACL|nr:Rieske (2Fe-2S) protein [Paenibacillus filicis]MCZ8511698.1 Rieske (2Fe-2S) protein [Paenibacillus filicis]
MREFTIGREVEFAQFPAPIEIDHSSYYLLKNNSTYLLASRVCPHMGYPVDVSDGEIVCFLHGWNFDEKTGICKHIPYEGLTTYPVFLRNGEFIALI